MNAAQFLAADPKVNAWVAASAGTGKTKVLTDRILNLLLQGFDPSRILCLTFTKAAAAEMSNRLTQRLAQWATLSTSLLEQDLKVLQGKDHVSLSLIRRARHLFVMVLDVPGGMKIQTIHSFCQSVLTRFPLEANVPSHFQVLDDFQAEEQFLEAQKIAFRKADKNLKDALQILNSYMSDQRFSLILNDFYQRRTTVKSLLIGYQDLWGYIQYITRFLEVELFLENLDDLLKPHLLSSLKEKFVPKNTTFDIYQSLHLTKNLEIRKKLQPDQIAEAERILRFSQSLSALEIAQRTTAFLILFQEIIQNYEIQKARQGVLDYEDLIVKTQQLLNQPDVSSWVLYKLDGGIEHLLIDEAQDTNPLQWEIILRLTEEFFTSPQSLRTVFAVGDAKQSIYSFQGANPHDFLELKDYFADLTQKTGQNWREVQLDLSYRSTPEILEMVDEVFANTQNRQGVSFQDTDIVHQAFRQNHLGRVELWPLIKSVGHKEEKTQDQWSLPLQRVEQESSSVQLANYLAHQVVEWIHSQEILPSTNNPIQPRDILILVRKRNALSHEIIRALKKHHIPVAGTDRLVLKDHIAIMDLLALGQFVLLPEDDLVLACILKSPLIGLSEEDLFALAYERQGTLWASLAQKAAASENFGKAYLWLKNCLSEADLCSVYEFYSWVLIYGKARCNFLSRLGHEVEDVLDEFLTQAFHYDQEHSGSLQGFISFMNRYHQEIKRDTSDATSNQVRIMTIHGAKGLQAPIVILPDATDSESKSPETLLWGDDLVLIRPTQNQDISQTQYLKMKSAQGFAEEKRRLLYVALTRAQDRLYVGGCASKDIDEYCWYRIIENTMKKKEQKEPFSYPSSPKTQPILNREIPLLSDHYPSWLYINPLETKLEKKQAPSPIPINFSIERGILIHRFFEYLPQFSSEHRHQAALSILKKVGLDQNQWEEDIHATLNIMNAPAFAEIFSPCAFVEVPIRGFIADQKLFEGRIDRLLVNEETITIVDYKTDKIPAIHQKDIPKSYVQQLNAYASILQKIYPHHKIRQLILWTSGPYLQEVPSA